MTKIRGIVTKEDYSDKPSDEKYLVVASDINEIVSVVNENDDLKTSKGTYAGTTGDLKDELDTAIFGGGETYQTKALADAALPQPENTPCKIANDPTSTLNGNWAITGGVWVQNDSVVSSIIDNEDISTSGSSLIISDRVKDSENTLGYYRIRKDFDWASDLSAYANSKLEIVHDFDLGGGSVVLPDNVTLKNSGGVFSNGVVTGLNTKIDSEMMQLFGVDVDVNGTWDLKEIQVELFGAKSDYPSTDNTLSIQKTFDFAYSILTGDTNLTNKFIPKVVFATGKGYLSTSTVYCLENIDIEMNSPLMVSSPSNTPIVGLKIGGDENSRNNTHVLDVRRVVTSDWSSDLDIGIQIDGLYACDLRIKRIEGFAVGTEISCAYTNARLGEFRDNGKGIKMQMGVEAFANQNIFIGGEFAVVGSVNSGLPRYGITIFDTETVSKSNSNRFVGQSYEISSIGAGAADCYSVWLETCENIVFESQRFEGSGDVFAKLTKDVRNCEFNILYTADEYSKPSINLILDESTYKINNRIVSKTTTPFNSMKLAYDSGWLPDKVNYYDASNKYITDLEYIINTSPVTFGKTASNLPYPDGNGDMVFESRFAGVRIGTERAKNLFVYTGNSSDHTLYVIPFDSDGNQIQESGKVFKNRPTPTFSYNSGIYGGLYFDDSGLDGDRSFVQVSVEEDVHSVFIGFGFGVVNQFQIYASDRSRWFNHYYKSNKGKKLATQIPTLGTYNVGEVLTNDNPLAGGVIGWICVASGTPGTWKSLGSIEA